MALKSKLKFAERTGRIKQKGIFFTLSDQNTFALVIILDSSESIL